MNTARKLFALLLACTLLCAAALADDSVRVTGAATVKLPADYAEVVIGASSRDVTVQAAATANAAILNSVLAAVTGTGVPLDDIATVEYSITPTYDYHYDENGNGRSVLNGYAVQNMIRVTVRDLSLVNTVIDAATAAGANESYGLTYGATNTAAAADQALAAAVQEGIRRAKIAAAAMGREIDEVTDVTESTAYGSIYARNDDFAVAAKEAETPLLAGEQTCTVTVEVTCSLK